MSFDDDAIAADRFTFDDDDRFTADDPGEELCPSKALPNTLGSRCMLVLVNLFLIPASGGVLSILYSENPPQDLRWRIVYYLFSECVLLLLIICVLSFLWAVARPRWIAQTFDGLYKKFHIVVAVSLASAWLCLTFSK